MYFSELQPSIREAVSQQMKPATATRLCGIPELWRGVYVLPLSLSVSCAYVSPRSKHNPFALQWQNQKHWYLNYEQSGLANAPFLNDGAESFPSPKLLSSPVQIARAGGNPALMFSCPSVCLSAILSMPCSLPAPGRVGELRAGQGVLPQGAAEGR